MPPLWDIILVPVVYAYIIVAQSTKVEESFNIQAVHDLLYHGFDLSSFDHIEFPGAVPRTFVGALSLSALSKPLLMLIPQAYTKLDGQIIARSMLGLVNIITLLYLKNAAFKAIKSSTEQKSTSEEKTKLSNKGHKATKKSSSAPVAEEHRPWSFGLWFTLFLMCQFHLPFYMSRTLPNFFALPLTNYSFAQVFKGRYTRAISVLAFTTVVFRVEIMALTLALGLAFVVYHKLTILQLITPAVTGGVIGGTISAVVDSYFWQRFTVPEIESFIFNVIKGNSSEWGTEPFSKYFTKYFIIMFLPPHVPLLALVGYFVDPTKKILRLVSFASLVYVILISFQPHKEWRFVVYVAPVLTVLASNGASYITSKFKGSFLAKLGVILIFGSAATSMFISVVFAIVSSTNYPGGHAMSKFNEIIMMKVIYKKVELTTPITVHIDTLACTTGVTHFSEVNPASGLNITYDRTEDRELLASKWESFDYLITEVDVTKKQDVIPRLKDWRWKKIETIQGFHSLDTRGFRGFDPINLSLNMYFKKSVRPFFLAINRFAHQEDMLYIYERVPAPQKKPVKVKEDPVEEETQIKDEHVSETAGVKDKPVEVKEIPVKEETQIIEERVSEAPETTDKSVEAKEEPVEEEIQDEELVLEVPEATYEPVLLNEPVISEQVVLETMEEPVDASRDVGEAEIEVESNTDAQTVIEGIRAEDNAVPDDA